MVLNNVTKSHKILIKTNRLREPTSFNTVNFHKQRAITAESMVPYGPLSHLKKTSWYLNNVTKIHKILIKTIPLREQTSFQMVNFHKQRVITTESMVRYGPLSNLKKTS